QVDRAQSGRGGDDAGGGGGEGAIVDLGQDQNAHHRASISSTSARMMAASSDADPTMLPAGRSGGGAMASMARRGARSTPSSAAGRTASGLERAFITMGRAALRGVLSRRSAVTTQGRGRRSVSLP